MGFLFGGTPPSTWTSPTTATSTMPDWWQAAQQGLISQASQIAAQPYPTYSGPEVAPQSQMQINAENNADASAPQVNQDFTNSANQLNTAATNGQSLNPTALNSYMSPYTSSVVNDIATLGDQNLMNNILPQVNNTFTGAGQFGSTQNANITNQAILNEEQNIGQQQDAALNTGFQQAVGATQTGNAQTLQAGSALGALGNTTQSTNAAQTGLDYNLGTGQQQETQANYTNAYQNFENQAAYPLQQLGILQSSINNSAPTANYFGYTSTPLTSGLLTGSGSQASPLTTASSGLSGLVSGA